jgi:hypothetical protein
MSLIWNKFDADRPNEAVIMWIAEQCQRILIDNSINPTDIDAAKMFAANEVKAYESGSNDKLNKAIGIDIFRPHEFGSDLSNDNSLDELQKWLLYKTFDWMKGSELIKIELNKSFPAAGPTNIKGGRVRHSLDNLVTINNRKVAIEIETSGNLDNGFFTLRQAVRGKKANCGVMIVPWMAEKSGRADEGKALGKLDQEFNGSNNMEDGPIYRLAVIRLIDVYRRILAP